MRSSGGSYPMKPNFRQIASAIIMIAITSGLLSCSAPESEGQVVSEVFYGINNVTPNPKGTWQLEWIPIPGNNILYWIFVGDSMSTIDLKSPIQKTRNNFYETEDLTFTGNRCFVVKMSSDLIVLDENENIKCTNHAPYEFRGFEEIVVDDSSGIHTLKWTQAPVEQPQFYIFRRPFKQTVYDAQPFSATKADFLNIELPSRGERYCYTIGFLEINLDKTKSEFCYPFEEPISFSGISTIEFTDDPSKAVLRWIASPTKDVSFYKVLSGINNDELIAIISAEDNTSSFELTNLNVDEIYTYQVRAYDRFGRYDGNTRQLSIRAGNTNFFVTDDGQNVQGSTGTNLSNNFPPLLSSNSIGTFANPFEILEDTPYITTELLTANEGETKSEDFEIINLSFETKDINYIDPKFQKAVLADGITSFADNINDAALKPFKLNLTPAPNAATVATPAEFTLVVSNPGTPFQQIKRKFYVSIQPVNDTPILLTTVSNNFLVSESAFGQTINDGEELYSFEIELMGGPVTALDEYAENVSLAITSNDETLLPSNAITYTKSKVNGITKATITLRPTPYQNGSTTLNLTLNDGDLDSEIYSLPVKISTFNNEPTISYLQNDVVAPLLGTSGNPFMVQEDSIYISSEDIYIDEGGNSNEDGQSLVISWESSNSELVKARNIQLVREDTSLISVDDTGDFNSIVHRIKLIPEENAVSGISVKITMKIENFGGPNQVVEKDFYYQIASINDEPEITATVSNASTPEKLDIETISTGDPKYSFRFEVRGGPENAVDEADDTLALTFAFTNESPASLFDVSDVTYTMGALKENGTRDAYITVRPADFLPGTSTLEITITDGGTLTSQLDFPLTVNSINNIPKITSLATDPLLGSYDIPISLEEDAAVSQIISDLPLLFDEGGASDEDIQNLNFQISSNRPLHVRSENISLVKLDGTPVPSIGASNASAENLYLKILPELDANTSSIGEPIEISITITDSGSPNKQFTKKVFLVITPVNDPPTITQTVSPLVIQEDVTSNWIRLDLSEGGESNVYEDGQNVYVEMTSSNPALINISSILLHESNSADADFLYFKIVPTDNQSGVSTLTFTARDHLNPASPEALTSTTTIDVTVAGVDDPPEGAIYCRESGNIVVTHKVKARDSTGDNFTCSGPIDIDSAIVFEIYETSCDTDSGGEISIDGASGLLTIKNQPADCETVVTAQSNNKYIENQYRHSLTIETSEIVSIEAAQPASLSSQCELEQQFSISDRHTDTINLSADYFAGANTVADATYIRILEPLTKEILEQAANDTIVFAIDAINDMGYSLSTDLDPITFNETISSTWQYSVPNAGSLNLNGTNGKQVDTSAISNVCNHCEGKMGAVIAGGSHSCSIHEDGNLYCWGKGENFGFTGNISVATLVAGFANSRAIAAG